MDQSNNQQPDVAGEDQEPRPGEGQDTGETAGDGQASPESELKAEQERAETYLRKWQRAAADLQNYKRRTEEERAEQAELQKATLIINVLPVFDDLDRAVESVDANLAGLGWVQGIVNIHRKFSSLLENMGVEPVEAYGAEFDPNVHEAVGQQPGPDGQVVAVLQKGYRLGERVLRPALVIVGNGDDAGTQQQASPEQEQE